MLTRRPGGTAAWLGLAAWLVAAVAGQTRTMTISAIFDQGGDPKHELAFKHAVQVVNRNRSAGRSRLLKLYLKIES